MEGAFGADFTGVRVHTGPEADALNNSMSARAFTTGQDIFPETAEYNPGTPEGQRLLAPPVRTSFRKLPSTIRVLQRGSVFLLTS